MKHTLSFVCVFSFCFNVIAMDPVKSLNNFSTSMYDKWNPESILEELKKGISKDPRERITQMHRLDRLIPYRIDGQSTSKLCDDLTTIISKNFPISDLSKQMASDYLLKKRPVEKSEKIVFDRINQALDLLKPSQIVDDFEKNELYICTPRDIETRVSNGIEKLIAANDIFNLMALIQALKKRNGIETVKIGLVPRVEGLARKYLEEQEKKVKENKEVLDQILNIKQQYQ